MVKDLDLILDPEEQKDLIGKLVLIKQLRGMEPDEVLEKTTTTYLAVRIKPRLKDYETIYLEKGKKISGCSGRLEIKGKIPWPDGTHGMPDNVERIFVAFGKNYVSKNITKSAASLVETTLTEIFQSENKQKIRKYSEAIHKSNFIYMMLQMAVKLIGKDLYIKNIDSNNITLNYMTKMIEEDNRKITKIFKEAFESGDINVAVLQYYDILSKYFQDFLEKKHLVSGEDIKKMGLEQQLVEDIGDYNILLFIGYLVGEIQQKVSIAIPLFAEEVITIE